MRDGRTKPQLCENDFFAICKSKLRVTLVLIRSLKLTISGHAVFSQKRTLVYHKEGHLPLQAGTVDVIPPAVGGVSQPLGCGLTLKGPKAVGTVCGAEVAPDGHQGFAVGALEAETLPVTVDPAHVLVFMRLRLKLSPD